MIFLMSYSFFNFLVIMQAIADYRLLIILFIFTYLPVALSTERIHSGIILSGTAAGIYTLIGVAYA